MFIPFTERYYSVIKTVHIRLNSSFRPVLKSDILGGNSPPRRWPPPASSHVCASRTCLYYHKLLHLSSIFYEFFKIFLENLTNNILHKKEQKSTAPFIIIYNIYCLNVTPILSSALSTFLIALSISSSFKVLSDARSTMLYATLFLPASTCAPV